MALARIKSSVRSALANVAEREVADSKRCNNCSREAEVGEYTRYQMRKTVVANLLTSGVDIKTLMEISGHKQAKTLLDSYAFGTTESLQAAVRVVDSYALLCDTA